MCTFMLYAIFALNFLAHKWVQFWGNQLRKYKLRFQQEMRHCKQE